jgi:prepilin-type N-terminal cleavage/methylation domain-containing protein
MTAQDFKLNKGFTLIELLVVIGILAILLAITLIAINPARQFGQANDTKRRSDLTAILNAIGQYSASNAGNLPQDILDGDYGVANDTPLELNSTNFPDLCEDLVPDYLPAIPVDPTGNDQDGIEAADCAAAWDTGDASVYQILMDGQNRITVSASVPYAGPIQVTR